MLVIGADRLALIAVLGFLAGCGRGLWGIGGSDDGNPDGSVVDPNPVPAGLSVCFADHPSSCDETCRQATRVLWQNCASCHHGDESYGLPPWDFVMDPLRLITETWSREGQSARFVLPGDPAHSAVYQRAVITRDMPPVRSDLSQPYYPRVNDADGETLRVWIESCLVASPDAGFHGVGKPVPCPSNPGGGGSCEVENQNCLDLTETCLCTAHQWRCVSCPASKPTVGASCASAAVVNGHPVAYRCDYGNVVCSCDPGTGAGQWECGVCPVSHPQDGAACGTSSFSCPYAGDVCTCGGNRWSCAGPSACPSVDEVSSASCRGPAACVYQDTGQACSCSPAGSWDCL